MTSEPDLVEERYSRRTASGKDGRYSMLNPDIWRSVQERQRALIGLLSLHADKPLNQLRALEIGCGCGRNLLELLRLGFAPANLMGNELLRDRVAAARENLPAAIELYEGDAAELEFEEASFDIVYQFTVFSSLLDDEFQQKLAARMWDWVRPGGGVLWFDFTYDNPDNPDVRGVKVRRIVELFPNADIDIRRVILAPPISRRVCRVNHNLYPLFNSLPFLRTHVLCWIGKT